MLSPLSTKILYAPVVAASLLAVTGPVLADDAQQRPHSSCAFVDRIYNFKEVDDRTAIVWTSPSRAFKVTFFNSCRDMRWAFSARVESRPGICLSRGDVIVFGRNGFGHTGFGHARFGRDRFDDPFAERCMVDRVEALPRPGDTAPRSSSY